MEIKIGEITLGGDSVYQISPGITGFGTPNIRTGDGVYAGADGGYISSQLYGAREITIPGFYITPCDDHDLVRLRLLSKLRIRYLYPIFIKTFGGYYRYTEGYVSEIKADIDGPKANEFQITMICPDPLFYEAIDFENPSNTWLEKKFTKVSTPGFVISYTSPVPWTDGSVGTYVDGGMVETYPIITLGTDTADQLGGYTNPVVVNLTTGEYLGLSGTYASGYLITIDMKKQMITQTYNGAITSLADKRTSGSTFWTLAPGANYITLTTDSQSDRDYGMIKYRHGYQGI